jgi:hypothetical protein
MFILIFIICFALILFTGLFLMKSNIDFIESENKRYYLPISCEGANFSKPPCIYHLTQKY